MTGSGMRRRLLASRGEDFAAAYLTGEGYHVMARNWRTRDGELDIVARDGKFLVFVEVRTRRVMSGQRAPVLGIPEESITPRKRARLVAMAEAYLLVTPWGGPWRIDVIALEIDSAGSIARLNHIQDAVGGVA